MLRRNILFFHQAALGDFIMTWPLMMATARIMAQSRIIAVTAAGKGKLAEHVLRIESADSELFSALWNDASSLPPPARKLLDGASLICNFVAPQASDWARNLAALAPAASIVSIETAAGDRGSDPIATHIANQLAVAQPALSAGALQMIETLSRRGFGSSPAERRGVTIHPGSGAEQKNWPRQRFVELAGLLRERSVVPVTVVLGEAEIERWGDSAEREFFAVAHVVKPRNLIELADVLARSQLVIANDSGPAHLAAIQGVPLLSLFGPASHAARWRPIGPHVTVLEAEPLASLAVQTVLDAAEKKLKVAEIG